MAKAKIDGVYKGRKPRLNPAEVRKLKEDGKGPAEIARQLKCGRASIDRLLGGPGAE